MYLCRGTKYFALIVLIFLQTCNARKSKHYYCPTSACGNIRNISYPFRLNTDPEYCGYGLPLIELACEGNQTVKWLFSKKLHVQAIDYDHHVIRLVDPTLQTQDDLCPFRPQLITFYQYYNIFETYRYHYGLELTRSEPIFMFNCPFALNNSTFVEITGCKLNGYTYLRIGEMSVSEVSDGCRAKFIGLTSWPNIKDAENNISLSDFHQAILYGFELGYYLFSSRPSIIEQILSTSLGQLHRLLENLMYKLQYFGIFGQKIRTSLRPLLYFTDKLLYDGQRISIIQQILRTSLSLLVYFMGKLLYTGADL